MALIDPTLLTSENGLLENAQIVILVLSTLVFWMRLYQLIKLRHLTLLAFGLFISNLPFVGAGRELSFGAAIGADPDLVTTIQIVMATFWAALTLCALGLFILRVSPKLAAIGRYFTHPTSLNIYAAILIFGLSSAFEQGAFYLPHSTLMEELLELVAFSLILRAAWVLREKTRP
ncbi:hypothetical protein EDD53_1214 [Pacificibacter maritimus]|uniref:Uncharacterized protein n=1 Tax=Pacificibacter maritimus TaxID=762213 RepID=A0A3N4UN77_9RHOB|nr:hypothetical protein [Pacificibacter maritimus]RPE72072.1 hypothetical protein EDD53_1214 [Pacificibacter maritimus]